MAAISSTSRFSSQPQLPSSSSTASPSGGGGRHMRGRRSSSFVMLESAAAAPGRMGGRTRSLTEEDLEELKGCLDLGFGFAYHEIPELRETLPALELCYSMTRRFLDEQRAQGQEQDQELAAAAPTLPLQDWTICGPGDDPEEVKARLKYWAQTVACTLKLCS